MCIFAWWTQHNILSEKKSQHKKVELVLASLLSGWTCAVNMCWLLFQIWVLIFIDIGKYGIFQIKIKTCTQWPSIPMY